MCTLYGCRFIPCAFLCVSVGRAAHQHKHSCSGSAGTQSRSCLDPVQTPRPQTSRVQVLLSPLNLHVFIPSCIWGPSDPPPTSSWVPTRVPVAPRPSCVRHVPLRPSDSFPSVKGESSAGALTTLSQDLEDTRGLICSWIR